jgi:hypothetical protein
VALLCNRWLNVLLGLIEILRGFGFLHFGSRITVRSHSGRDATANANPILNTPRPLSWSKWHISSPQQLSFI